MHSQRTSTGFSNPPLILALLWPLVTATLHGALTLHINLPAPLLHELPAKATLAHCSHLADIAISPVTTSAASAITERQSKKQRQGSEKELAFLVFSFELIAHDARDSVSNPSYDMHLSIV